MVLKNRVVLSVVFIIFLIIVGVIAYLEQKSVWDTLELIGVPLVLLFFAFHLTTSEGELGRKNAIQSERYEIERHFYDAVTNILLGRGSLQNRIDSPHKDMIFAIAMGALRRLHELQGDSHIKTIMEFMRDSAAFQADQNLLLQIVETCKNEDIPIPKQLVDAKLQANDLHKIDLGGWNLGGSILSSANLRESNLSGSYLGGAVLSNADLSGADLRGANLDRAIMFNSKLDGVLWDENTILPDGQNWSPSVDLSKYIESDQD